MDNYKLLQNVGKGAYGMVYLHQRKSDDKHVIIKKIPVNQLNPSEIEAALNEAQVLKMLNHSNIIQYYESFLENEYMVISMEYAEGGNVDQFLQSRQGKLLPEYQILRLFSQISLALHHVHSHNILHRDLKTANILLDKSRRFVKLGDFGISIVLNTLSKAETIVGTPCYLSPEQCEGKKYNKKSDMWALGCTLYELVTLKKAFEAETLPTLILRIMDGITSPIDRRYSSRLLSLIKDLLQLDPEARLSTDQLLARPILINVATDLYTDIGKIPAKPRHTRAVKVPISSSNTDQ